MKISAAEQFRILSSGTEQIVPAEEFKTKLERSVASGTPLRVKMGIDPSSPDIHIGHAVGLRKMRRFQQLGHVAVLIIGDFTGRVGDPSGRSETRRSLETAEVEANAKTYVEQAKRILLADNLEVRWNSEWLDALGTGGMLHLASQMTVARMLERDDFAKRYGSGQPISMIEFCYPLLQGYDSVAIDADVELGGTDQLFNLLVGRDLQSKAGKSAQIAMTLPLLEGLDGVQKMSKSYGNYIGVSEEPSEMYGKLMSVPDSLLGKYLRLTTDLDPSDVDALEASAAEGGKAAANAKRRLAHEVTTLYHGSPAADAAAAHFDRVHVERALPDEIRDVSFPSEAADGGRVSLPRLLVALGFASSTSDARRLIDGRAVRIDGDVVTDAKATYSAEDLTGKIVQSGKRAFAKITP